MRHPTTGLSEDDLSRLTGSSSSTASSDSHSSCSSSSSSPTSPISSPTLSPTISKTQQNGHNQSHKGDGLEHTKERSQALDAEFLKNLRNSKSSKSNSSTNNNSPHNSHFNSSYLPEIIDPLDWQKSNRKRKERLDSTSSSTTSDRKVIRSNSEELLQQGGVGLSEPSLNKPSSAQRQLQEQQQQQGVTADAAIRRVSSADFNRATALYSAQELRAPLSTDAVAIIDPASKTHVRGGVSDENDAYLANRPQQQAHPPTYQDLLHGSAPTRDMTRRARYETSPARSPNRNGNGKHHRDSDDSEGEHERRRNSERFCKSRAPPGRKASGVIKKTSSKYLPGRENAAYRYDLAALKQERRGFVSRKSPSINENNAVAPPGANINSNADANDNNLIDFRSGREQSPPKDVQHEPNASSSTAKHKIPSANINYSCAEALPWDNAPLGSVNAAEEPMLSRRYATMPQRYSDSIDTAAKFSKVMPYPQQFHKQAHHGPQLLMGGDDDCLDPMVAFRALTSLENVRTSEVMQQVLPTMKTFQSPDERLKQVNRRLAALKKKIEQFEESFEKRLGYRPSQAERSNDKYIMNVLSEISKLRKEKQALKSDPMAAIGLKISGGTMAVDAANKLEKMKSTLSEIEKNLADKRQECQRSLVLEDLSPEQLLQEKTAVQHGLLYFESLYGRPASKEERDAARPLYERYRLIKRMVSRSVSHTGVSAAGAPDLPTILENEAMVFEATPLQYSPNNSTETSNSPSDSGSGSLPPSASASDDSNTTTTTNTGNIEAEAAAAAATAHKSALAAENVSVLSLEQLWELLEKTREEKRTLKRTIREFEMAFEEENGRKMLKSDRRTIEETYAQYKGKKAKVRLLQALIKKHISR